MPDLNTSYLLRELNTLAELSTDSRALHRITALRQWIRAQEDAAMDALFHRTPSVIQSHIDHHTHRSTPPHDLTN